MLLPEEVVHASLKLAMNFIKALPGSTRLKIKPYVYTE